MVARYIPKIIIRTGNKISTTKIFWSLICIRILFLMRAVKWRQKTWVSWLSVMLYSSSSASY